MTTETIRVKKGTEPHKIANQTLTFAGTDRDHVVYYATNKAAYIAKLRKSDFYNPGNPAPKSI